MSTARLNPIHVLNTLPADEVKKLATAANALAAKHLQAFNLGFFRRRSALVGCKECHRTWLRNAPPAHADWCPVGHIQETASRIIALSSGPLPKHLPAPAPVHPLRRSDDFAQIPSRVQPPAGWPQPISASELRITEIPQERSDDGKTETGRPGGDLAEFPLIDPSEPDYREPLAWDPLHNAVVDRDGKVVADMVNTDLSILEQERFGLRIAICVNYFAGDSNTTLREAQSVLDASRQAATR